MRDRQRDSDSQRGEIRVTAARRRSPAAPPPGRPAPPAPALLIGGAVVGVALLLLGTVRGAAPEEATRPSTAEATEDDFADILSVSTTMTPTTTTVDVISTQEPAAPTVEAVDAVEANRSRMIDRATLFMSAIGDGHAEEAGQLVIVDSSLSHPLGNMARFYAQFHSGLRASICDPVGSNAVSCLVLTTDPALELVGIGSPRQRVIVSFGPAGGVATFSVPAAFGSATARLAMYAREIAPEVSAPACDLDAYDESFVLPIAVGFAATPECGTVLAGMIPVYLAAGP